jgi:hypothetical protein
LIRRRNETSRAKLIWIKASFAQPSYIENMLRQLPLVLDLPDNEVAMAVARELARRVGRIIVMTDEMGRKVGVARPQPDHHAAGNS